MTAINKWRARIRIRGVEHHIGVYPTIDEAQIARMEFYEQNIQFV